MSIRPKYTAAVEFSVAGNHFAVGDEVTDPLVLDAVVRFGDRFVTTDTRRARKTSVDTQVADEPTTTTITEESQ